MKKQLLFGLLISCFAANAQSYYVDSVNFDNYISPSDNDLVNDFSGTYFVTQIDSNGITGGCLLPESSFMSSDNATYNKKYYLNQSDSLPTTGSICFKYSLSAAKVLKYGPYIDFTFENDSRHFFSWADATLAYDDISGYTGSRLYVQGAYGGFGTTMFPMTDGHWFKLVLQISVQTVDTVKNLDTISASAYLYDIGVSGTDAPTLIFSNVNRSIGTDNFELPNSYMYPHLNGAANGGVVYLDNYNISGYRYPTANVQKFTLKDNNIAMPTFVSNILPVRSNLKSSVSYYIYDMAGRAIKDGTFINNTNINVSTLPSSNYFIRFINDNKTLVKRFVKR